MKYIILLAVILFNTQAYSQPSNGPVEVTPTLEKKIKQEVENDVLKFKEKLSAKDYTDLDIEFATDTFRVHRFIKKYVEYDYSTSGMMSSGYEAAKMYDALLNKYYKKLQAVLSPEDRKALVSAQKAWISFRDSELKLAGVIGKDEYSGGGTVQLLIDSSYTLDIVRKRTIDLFEHLKRGTQDI